MHQPPSKPRKYMALAAGLLLGLLYGPIAAAGPADVTRVLKSITFEERRLGNREELPMDWTKIEGSGLPHYVNGRLSDDRARSGKYSFKFELNGGSLIYRYDPMKLPVRLGSHYHVESYAQTSVLAHARARMTAFFIDIDGHPLNQPHLHSETYAARTDDEGWHRLTIEAAASDPRAAFLAVQLELLQPSIYAPSTLGDRTIFDQDITGQAWFDDVTISQVPQVVLMTSRPGNVFRRSDPLRLEVTVSDRFTDDLTAQVIVSDARGTQVFQSTGALSMAAAQTIRPGEKQTSIDLPDLPPGWYCAQLKMTSKQQTVGEQELYLVHLADDDLSVKPDPRFGLIATDLPFEGWAQLPDILPIMAAGRVKLAVWSKDGDIQKNDSAAFDALLERFQSLGITPTACLTGVPPTIAEKIGGDSWAQLTRVSPNLWREDLAYLVARHANHLDRWQFGADQDAATFLEDPDMRRVYDLLYKEFAAVIDKPDLAMPWPAWYDLAGKLPATVALSVPPEVLPRQIPLYMQDIRSHAGHNLSLSLQMLDNRYGREVQIRDVAQRAVYALAAGADRIDFPLPFFLRKDNGRVSDEPREMLMVIRTLVTQLGGAAFRGRIPIANNIDAFLFDRAGVGVLVMWDRAAGAGQAGENSSIRQLALTLADQPRRIDLWGNVTPLVNTTAASGDTVGLEVGALPTFLVGIDTVMAQMRGSVAFDQPLLESSFEPHARRIRFTNPGKSTIGGALKLAAPAGWTLTPSVFSFTLNPGETFDREVNIEFPYNSFAGPKTITANFQVQAERNSNFSVPITLSLGLSDIGMQTTALRDKNDLIVQQTISNYGNRPIDYTAFAAYPGQPRQERLVTQLAPGKTTIKLYRFPNVQFIANATVRSGLRELEGTRILNDEVPVQ